MDCPKVIIIEDDADIRETFVSLLETEGYEVSGFSNGKEAIDGLRNCDTSCLILLDLMMPVMNGWEFLEARNSLQDTIVASPVFIVSAMADKKTMLEAGAKGYLKKPLDFDVLLNIVRSHCKANKAVA